MFEAVPPRYDLINRVITWGMDQWWRRLAAEACLAVRPRRFLDVGCGTGDLAIRVAGGVSVETEITGIDYSGPMLKIAREKAEQLGRKITFMQGDADNLPFDDGYFDCVGISFAFRNLTYKNPVASKHLREVRRVLREGGRYVIVESSQPKSGLIRWFFHLYLRGLVRNIGYWLSGNRGAYHYLAESASRYYTAEEVKEMLLEAGFREVSFRRLFFGAACLHVAVK